MANALITPTIIAKEALMQVENNLVMANRVHRQYRKEWMGKTKVGETIELRRPVRFVPVDGATLSVQDVEEGYVNLTINYRKHVAWKFLTQDLTTKIEDYSERYITPAAIALANAIDASLTGEYYKVANHVGTPGTTPATFAALGLAGRKLDDYGVPTATRTGVFDPAAAWALAGGLTSVYVQDKARTAFEEAKIGRYARMDNFMDQNIVKHTVGVASGTPLVNGATQNVTYAASKTTWSQSLITNGWTNDTTGILKAGDVITLEGVNGVNPVSKQDTGQLQEFTVLADADSGASTGPATLTISPPIITSGNYKTCTAAPADDAVITVKTGTGGTPYPQNLAFHRNAFALAMIPLEMPDGAAFKARISHKGLSFRVVKDYDQTNDYDVIRIDALWAASCIYPELACRVTG